MKGPDATLQQGADNGEDRRDDTVSRGEHSGFVSSSEDASLTLADKAKLDEYNKATK